MASNQPIYLAEKKHTKIVGKKSSSWQPLSMLYAESCTAKWEGAKLGD